MPELIITEAASGETGEELIIGDGLRERDLLGTPPDGLYLVELELPVPTYENTYAKGADAEGQDRTRSLGQNSNGRILVRIDRTQLDATAFRGELDDLQDIIGSAHKRKGYIRYRWPNGRSVTYDLQSCIVAGIPQKGAGGMIIRIAEPEITFECDPFGRLDPITIFEDEPFNSPIGSKEVNGIPGHVDAFATLTLQETSGNPSNYVEYAYIQEGYVAGAPLLIDEDTVDLTGTIGSQPDGAGTVIHADLTPTPMATVRTGEQPHQGVQKIFAKTGGHNEGCWMRFAYSIDGGSDSYGPWVRAPGAANDRLYSTHLDTIDLTRVTDHWEGRIEAYADAGSQPWRFRHIAVIPAEVHGIVRQPPAVAAGTSYTVIESFDDMTLGDLNGQSSDVGGLWTGPVDFQVDEPASNFDLYLDGQFVRLAEAGVNDRRLMRAAPNISGFYARCTISMDRPPPPADATGLLEGGILARYQDADNYAGLFWNSFVLGTIPVHLLRFQTVVAGDINIDQWVNMPQVNKTFQEYPIALAIDETGAWSAYSGSQLVMTDQDFSLGPSGPLEDGKVGLLGQTSSSVVQYQVGWNDFSVIEMPTDHVLWPNKHLKIDYVKAARDTPGGGTPYGRVLVDGDHLRLPPSTEALVPGLLVVRRRSFDIAAGLPDEGFTDDLTGTLVVEPRVLVL